MPVPGWPSRAGVPAVPLGAEVPLVLVVPLTLLVPEVVPVPLDVPPVVPVVVIPLLVLPLLALPLLVPPLLVPLFVGVMELLPAAVVLFPVVLPTAVSLAVPVCWPFTGFVCAQTKLVAMMPIVRMVRCIFMVAGFRLLCRSLVSAIALPLQSVGCLVRFLIMSLIISSALFASPA